MRTILVVEDEPQIAALVRDYLVQGGFEPILAHDGEAGLREAKSRKPDLVILDLGLPKRDGIDVIRELRKTSNVPVVVLTARGEESDRILGLELGTDYYVVKPFSPRELVARVRAVLRRVDSRGAETEVIRAGDLEVDLRRLRATIDGRTVDLTAMELQLLAQLAREPGRVFTRGQLLDALHGIAFESFERAIDAHIKNIRKKIEPEPSKPRYIQTVYGVGYRFADQ
jgi:DNA-binding response OmpR family regulator